jgi:Carbohydrate family 9 binding domain-like
LTASAAEVTARRLTQPAGAFPSEIDWDGAQPVWFCHDWQGKNSDPKRQTEAALLWNDELLFVRFRCRYRTINVFADADSNGRRDELWDRDVAEIFLQPDRFGEKYYKEFEVSPNGQWLDLDITPEGLHHISSGMRSSVRVDENACVWTAELAIPMAAVTDHFDSEQTWRVNFFRCEGLDPERFYSAWQPTETAEPSFHVPQKFGWLRFEK